MRTSTVAADKHLLVSTPERLAFAQVDAKTDKALRTIELAVEACRDAAGSEPVTAPSSALAPAPEAKQGHSGGSEAVNRSSRVSPGVGPVADEDALRAEMQRAAEEDLAQPLRPEPAVKMNDAAGVRRMDVNAPEGERPEGKASTVRIPSGKTSDDRTPHVADSEDPLPGGPAPGHQAPEGKILDGRAPEAKAREGKGPEGMTTIDADRGPLLNKDNRKSPSRIPPAGGGGKGSGGGGTFHKRLGPTDFEASLKAGIKAVRHNLAIVMLFTVVSNVLVLAIPIYLFQISDRIFTSRSIETLVMLTVIIVGAILLQSMFDALRRFILMRTAVEIAVQLGAPILSAAARASLHGTGREYQTLGDLQQVRSFLVSRTLLSFLDAPIAPIFVVAIFLIHIDLGFIVVATAVVLLILTQINQKVTAAPFNEANSAQVKANLHLESMSRNSQIINALAMIPEAVWIWGRDTASSLRSQVIAQDRNIAIAALSKATRLLTQVSLLGWGAFLSLEGELTGGMVIAASVIAGRALAPIEGAIEGWNQYSQAKAAYGRISALLRSSPLAFERLTLPKPQGQLDVERLLYVPQGTKRVVLNGLSFALKPGDSLAIIGNSGAGKTTLGKMLVGSILPTSGNVRLDLMDLRNWDPRQFGENIGYLPQDVQLFPGTIKANIARMRDDADDASIYKAAMLADVHEMIANLPHGYETVVSADGSPLSGGQKQRVALARAFFGEPRFVVLDEPNSNLDKAGDAALLQALQHAKEKKITMVTITQRPALLANVDKILLLVNGTIALFGARADVMKALEGRGVALDAGSFGHQLL